MKTAPEVTAHSMTMHFEFATANRILFGQGVLTQVGPIAASMGSNVFLLTGNSIDRARPLLSRLEANRLTVNTFQVSGEPSVTLVAEAVDKARRTASDLVIGLGGGSVIDTAKAVAAMLANEGDLEIYLEVVGEGKPIQNKPVPCIAIPTTAGTGAEVTRNAVLSVPEHKRKVSMRHAWMLPDTAIIDPELTYTLPPALTATTGLDAMTQLIEPFVSLQANPLTDGLCREGLRRAARSLETAFHQGDDIQAREDMALAGLFGGLALANAKLGAVHGFAGPLGGELAAPHGAICGRLLPLVMEANVKALQAREPESESLNRFHELGPLLTGERKTTAQDAIDFVRRLCQIFKIPSLKTHGLTGALIPEIAKKSRISSSMKGNPIVLDTEELEVILLKAL